MDADRHFPRYSLRSELARFALREPVRGVNRRLAWVNSICILFLLIGAVGTRPGSTAIKTVPPIEQAIPALVEQVPPQKTADPRPRQEEDSQKPEPTSVVIVMPESPSIKFAVPTIGNLLTRTALNAAPPLEPLRPVTPLTNLTATLNNTGSGGERPAPPYPKIALDTAQQGTVALRLVGDKAGGILSVEIKESSGYPLLDRGAVDYVKRHWSLPEGATRTFETSITYRLERN